MQSGHWSSPNKLINDGLRVVRERHRLWNVQKREFSDELLRPALKEFKLGKVVAYDSDILGHLKTRKPRQIRSAQGVIRTRRSCQVYLSRLALRDLHYYWENACNPKPISGDRFFRKVDRMLESLGRKPGKGKKREELGRNLRSLGSYTLAYPWFVIFYSVTKYKVCVFRILHWTYDPPSRMSFP